MNSIKEREILFGKENDQQNKTGLGHLLVLLGSAEHKRKGLKRWLKKFNVDTKLGPYLSL